MTECFNCDMDAETDKGVIYVRANIKFNNLSKWKPVAICPECFKVAERE